MKPWDTHCNVPGCGAEADDDEWPLCQPHLQSWRRTYRDLTQPVKPLYLLMVFERWASIESRRLAVDRALERLRNTQERQ